MKQNLYSDNSHFVRLCIPFCCLLFQLALIQGALLPSEFYVSVNVNSFPWTYRWKYFLPGCTKLGFESTSASGLVPCQPRTTLI